MSYATVFEGRALEQQLIAQRTADAAHRSQQLIPLVLLFFILSLQLAVRIMVVERAYRLEDLRSAALKHDVLLRDLRSEYSQLAGPTQIGERARRELKLLQLPPQRMRKFLLPESE